MAHKKHQKKYLNILFIPDDESSPRRLRLRYGLLRLLAGLGIVLVVVLIFAAVTYGRLVVSAYENLRLREQNKILREQVARVEEMSRQLDELKNLGKKVRSTLTGYVNLNEGGTGLASGAREDAAGDVPFSLLTSLPTKAPVIGFVSQEYHQHQHNGIDIAAPEGTPVLAAGSGVVLFAGWTRDGGNTVIIGHPTGYYTFYKHNLRNVVVVNQKVEQGQVIAYLGNSGLKSSGPHLHFEVWKDGRVIDPRFLVVEYQ
ncbi:MAG: hypothetical protein Kow0037_04950 [Calditrichia bacterium]